MRPIPPGRFADRVPPRGGHIGAVAHGTGHYRHVPDRVLHNKYHHRPSRHEYERAVLFHRNHYERFRYHHARPFVFDNHHHRIFKGFILYQKHTITGDTSSTPIMRGLHPFIFKTCIPDMVYLILFSLPSCWITS
jgi:hypothetical protein